MEPTPLDEILSSDSKGDSRPRDDRGRWVAPPAPEAPTTTPTPTEVQAEAPPAPVQAVAPDVAPTPAADPAQEPRAGKDPVSGLQAGITAEREKRQAAESRAEAAERRIAEFEQRFAQLEQRVTAPPPPAQPQVPQFDINGEEIFSDPSKTLNQFGQQIQTRAIEQVSSQMLDIAEWTMRRAAPDYDDARNAFLAAVQKDPSLMRFTQGKPAHELVEAVYAKGKELVAAEEQRWMERLKPKFEQQYARPQAAQATPVPQSLNAEPSPSAPVVEFKPTPLGKALRTKL